MEIANTADARGSNVRPNRFSSTNPAVKLEVNAS